MNKDTKQIDQIFADLIAADPSFASNEKQAKLLIAQLLDAKSSVQVDPIFAANLRSMLALRMKQGESKKPLTYNFMNKLNLSIASAVVVAVVALAVFSGGDKVLLPGKQEIAMAGEGAFGSLGSVSASNKGQGGGGSAPASEMAAPLGSDAARSAIGAGGFGGGGIGIMPIPPTNYKFVYGGDEFTIDEDKMEVYRRLKGFGSTVDFNSFISQFAVELFNAGKFGSSKLEYFRVTEDRDFGYGLNIDLREGTINISENWERWQTAYNQPSFSPDQIPADEVVIKATNAFLDEYGINRENYGTPTVQNFWKMEYQRLAEIDRAAYYIPDIIGVVYPLKVAGAEIFDEGGNKNGMMVTYNIRVKKVSSVSELTSQRYEASAYAVEKDVNRIIEIAQRGGFRAWYPTEQNATTETVQLGTPNRVLVRLWHDLGGKQQDIYVPSLIFPISAAPDGFYGTSVIVPLVKDILDTAASPPTILPMDMPKG